MADDKISCCPVRLVVVVMMMELTHEKTLLL